MKFNWEEFLSNDKIAVHCSTEEQAKGFCKQMHEHGLTWNNGVSYLARTEFKNCKDKAYYYSDGVYSDGEPKTRKLIKVLEWSNYMNDEKENSMNLELSNLTDEQKKQIIELAEKFKQENEVDKLDYEKDYIVFNGSLEFPRRMNLTECEFKDQFFDLGLTAHTREETEKIRRRLLVEKELRDWAKKCKDPVCFGNGSTKYSACYSGRHEAVFADSFCNFSSGNIIFTDESVLKQAIESIGQERLIRDYFGIDN